MGESEITAEHVFYFLSLLKAVRENQVGWGNQESVEKLDYQEKVGAPGGLEDQDLVRHGQLPQHQAFSLRLCIAKLNCRHSLK